MSNEDDEKDTEVSMSLSKEKGSLNRPGLLRFTTPANEMLTQPDKVIIDKMTLTSINKIYMLTRILFLSIIC